MSFVFAMPEHVRTAATQLAGIGSTIDSATAAAAARTTQVLAAGADQVSGAVAVLFSGHAQAYQAISAQMAALHQGLVQNMSASAASYAGAEANNALTIGNNGVADLGLGNIGNGNIGGGNAGNTNLGSGNAGYTTSATATSATATSAPA
ncbi:PE family protein, partial [Mycobacterium interjectum]|uniref:PE family protein n=1 Tax=Mycobacterium interjectum TaxID=33895 RepID=UPI0021F28A9E